MTTSTLRVATFNIHHGARADGTLNLEEVAQVLEDCGADVIALQEVDRFFSERSAFVDQASWLGERLGLHAEFAGNIVLDPPAPGRPAREYGLALLTKVQPRERFHAYLPEPRVTERRGVLSAVVDVEGAAVQVFNTHLATGPGRIRRDQFRAVRELVDLSEYPAVVLGDLNAPSFNIRDYRTLTRGLDDAWKGHGHLLRRFLRGATSPATPLPMRRIDYVLTTPDITTRSIRRIRTKVSDHLPVVAELDIPCETL